jgi:hypothetical protein
MRLNHCRALLVSIKLVNAISNQRMWFLNATLSRPSGLVPLWLFGKRLPWTSWYPAAIDSPALSGFSINLARISASYKSRQKHIAPLTKALIMWQSGLPTD